ncbi:MAG: hypothetical protein JWQ27_778 [Ferruginibacter sp.]|nr:hypothetical protein [Ferruginibacter sp.]
MKIKILLLAISAAALGSCSTAYKSGQTPDDVYYSPARVVEENTKYEEQEEVVTRNDRDERQIRMATYDRRWRDLDYDYDYDYRYNPYRYGYAYGYYYNPYYYAYPVYYAGVKFTNPKNTAPRMSNLGSYHNNSVLTTNVKTGGVYNSNSSGAYNNSNRTTTTRRVILPTQSTSTRSTSSDNNTRTYTPPSSSSSSSSGTSSGTSVPRPARKQ